MQKSSVNIAFYRKVDRFQTGKFRFVSQQTFCLFDAEHPAAGNVAVGMLAFFRAALVGAPLRPGQETNPWARGRNIRTYASQSRTA